MSHSLLVAGDTALVTLADELDAYDAPALLQILTEAVESEATRLEVSLERVTFLDSTVLGLVVGARRHALARGREVVVRLPTGRARRIFELTGLDELLDGSGA
jgi:anti-sigma B factor antagonist